MLVTKPFYAIDRGKTSMEYLPKAVEGVPIKNLIPFETDVNWTDGSRTHTTYTKGINESGIESYIVIYDYYDENGEWIGQSDKILLWKLEGDTFRLWNDTDTLTDGSKIYKDGGEVLIRTALGL